MAVHDVIPSLWDLERHLRTFLEKLGGGTTHLEDDILDEITVSPAPARPLRSPARRATSKSRTSSPPRCPHSPARQSTPSPRLQRSSSLRQRYHKAITQHIPKQQRYEDIPASPQDEEEVIPESYKLKRTEFLHTSIHHALATKAI